MWNLSDEYAMAGALAPFLAEYYYATGEDLSDLAADDATIQNLAAAYARLPALAERAAEKMSLPGASARGSELFRQVNNLLYESAEAIRSQLGVLAG